MHSPAGRAPARPASAWDTGCGDSVTLPEADGGEQGPRAPLARRDRPTSRSTEGQRQAPPAALIFL
jgi:hypothetical protein